MSDVVLVLPSLRGGGAERVTLRLAEGLRDRGLAVTVAPFQATGPLKDDIPTGVRLLDLRAPNNGVATLRLGQELVRNRPRGIVAALDNAAQAAAILGPALRIPTVTAIHTTLSVRFHPGMDSQLRARLERMRRLYPRTRVVGCGEDVARDAAEVLGLPAERVATVYNPVVTPEVIARADEPVPEPWFQPGEPPVVIAVGRLAPEKDYPTLLRAFARLEGARLVFLGVGDEEAALRSLAAELGVAEQTEFLGFRANPFAYMRRAAVLALTSTREGLPTGLVEALAVGTPVVATDCRSGPREILEGGRYGALVPVGDVEAIAAGLAEAIRNPRPAPPEAWSRFTLDRAVEGYLAQLGISGTNVGNVKG